MEERIGVHLDFFVQARTIVGGEVAESFEEALIFKAEGGGAD